MLFQSAIPEFTATTGISAAMAALTADAMTAGSASVTAIPATLSATAERTRSACLTASAIV